MKFIFPRMTLFIVMIVLAGCGSSNQDVQPLLTLGDYPSRVGETTPSGVQIGGYLRLNESAEPTSLDPVRTGEESSHNVTMQMYDALLEFDRELNLHPCLAESYEVSPDGLVYTFHLRKGVRFHDDPCFPGGKGREMNAQDVKYSLTRVVDPKSKPRGAWLFLGLVQGADEFANDKAKEISGFQVADDFTFQITLIKPFAPFIYRLAMTFTFIHPHEAVEQYQEDFFQHPVGTGAFEFIHWKPNQEVLMVRNPNYWKKDKDGVQLPYLDGMRYTFISDLKPEFFEMETGNLDAVKMIHEDLWSRVYDEQGNIKPGYEKYQHQSQELFVTQYFGFYIPNPPFKDNKALRQAINYAIDREAIIKFVMNGRGAPAKGIVPPTMPGYKSIAEGYTYDPEKAKALLAEAGYPEGKGLGEITLDLNSGGTTNESMAEAVQGQLAQVGIRTRLNIVEWGQHLENLDNGRSTFFRLGWNADYPDPENFLMLMWSQNFSPTGSNYSHYINPEFDKLYEESITVQDQQKRFELYQQAEKIAVEDAPWLFLFYTKRYRLVQPYVVNHDFNAMEMPILFDVWLKQESKEVASEGGEVKS